MSRRRVMIVDDNDDLALSLAMICKEWGHEVRTARDGREALDLFAKFKPDVAILDLAMPRMNGYELARHLRKSLGDDVLLVAYTGFDQTENRAKATAAGFDYHLPKPPNLTILQQLIW